MLSLVHPSKLRISLSEHGVGQRIWTGPYGLITLETAIGKGVAENQ